MSRLTASVVAVAALVSGSASAAIAARFAPIEIATGSIARANGYTIDLGEPDDQKTPRAWQGPLKITAPTGRTCTASDDVAIIERPLSLVQGH